MFAGAALSVKELKIAYNHKTVVDNVTLSIPKGTITAIVGPNGAGKSTFVKGLLNLIPLQQGEVKFYGSKYEEMRKHIGYVPQRADIDWDFPVSVIEVVLMGLHKNLKWYQRFNKEHKTLARAALEQVGMEAYVNQHIKQLSGGQQQRVFLARALVEQANLYILDEPLVGIDKVTEKIIVQQLHRLKNEGKTIIVVHHDLNTIKQYFDHVILLNQQLIAYGDVRDTFTAHNLKHTFKDSHVIVGDPYALA